jgi:hypothetical protein
MIANGTASGRRMSYGSGPGFGFAMRGSPPTPVRIVASTTPTKTTTIATNTAQPTGTEVFDGGRLGSFDGCVAALATISGGTGSRGA